MSSELILRYKSVDDRISRACAACKRNRDHIDLLAVSKKHSIESIREIFSLGQKRFGENYASELFQKAEQLKDLDIQWVYIGALQSNKIGRLVEVCSEIQTVGSVKHLRYIDRYAMEHGKKDFPVFLQVNIANESQKSGFTIEQIQSLLESEGSFDNIVIKGLMAIPPAEDSKAASHVEIPKSYLKLSDLNSKMGFKSLSLGMSADLEAAIKVGSTCIRVGSDIFGPRLS